MTDITKDAVAHINALQVKIETHQSSMVALAVEAGAELLKLKEEVPEGEWMAWCKENIDIGRANINNYMQAAGHADLLEDYQRAGNASVRGFLKHIQVSKVTDNKPVNDLTPESDTRSPNGSKLKEALDSCRKELNSVTGKYGADVLRPVVTNWLRQDSSVEITDEERTITAAINGRDIMTKIQGHDWTVAPGAELDDIIAAAAALLGSRRAGV